MKITGWILHRIAHMLLLNAVQVCAFRDYEEQRNKIGFKCLGCGNITDVSDSLVQDKD